MIIPGIFGTGTSSIGGICGTFGVTGSTGLPGSVGLAGIPGFPGKNSDEKLITIFCKKDYGFIKSGQYVKVYLYSKENNPLGSFISFKSDDGKMSFYLEQKEADEYFVWRSTDLREHKLGSIGI
jgi:hypothetical protein